MRRLCLSVLAACSAFAATKGSVLADAGMWTFHDFPRELVRREHGADLNAAWLDRGRAATLRLSGCTGSFVSSAGLILTNHHCVEDCLDQHSSGARNLRHDGFLARTRGEELKCSSEIADVRSATEDVTAQVSAASAGLEPQRANEARKQR